MSRVESGWGVYLTIYLHLVQEIMNEWSYISTAQMTFHGVDRDSFTFCLGGLLPYCDFYTELLSGK
jgi:hypothetical protein